MVDWQRGGVHWQLGQYNSGSCDSDSGDTDDGNVDGGDSHGDGLDRGELWWCC